MTNSIRDWVAQADANESIDMQWSKVKLIYFRELRDQLRDRRTLFTIAVLPILLYPLLGMSFLQVAQFTREHRSTICFIGAEDLTEEPRLFDGENFNELYCPAAESRLLKVLFENGDSSIADTDEYRERVRREIQAGRWDAAVYFPPEFADRLAAARGAWEHFANNPSAPPQEPATIPEPRIFTSTASDKSRMAADRVERVLRRWRDSIVRQNLQQSNMPRSATEPFQVLGTDVAEEVSKRAAIWSKILPFVVLIWALTGAFYPAIDLCAGEKERGTLETLLSSPAQRSEIVWGKLLTVMTFSMATALLNLASMGLTGTFIISQLSHLGGALRIGPPPLYSVIWLAIALVPVSALFSALSLAIAAFARSSKEGQYYLMPLLMITLPLMILPLLPAAELNWGTSLIPVAGMMLLLRCLIEGQFRDAFTFMPVVIVVTSGCCWIAIRWAIDQFNNESVIFREGERWSLGVWLRHLRRDRAATPSFGAAILCGVALLLVRFFASFLMSEPTGWNSFAWVTVISQFGLIACLPLFMTGLLTTSWRQTLLLRWPGGLSLIAAFMLAVLLHPAATAFNTLVQWLYPLNPDALAGTERFQNFFVQAPWWSRLLVLAITPAICEELAFRGFILSGLRHLGHKWAAIVVASLFFGAVHGLVQQSLSACAVGIAIGYIAVQTGSLLPCLIFHATYNSLSLTIGLQVPKWIGDYEWLSWIFRKVGEDLNYQPHVAICSSILAAGFLLWFHLLPFRASEEERLQQVLDGQLQSAIK